VVRIVRTPGEIQLEVTDQGRGIDREIQARFFAGKSPGVGLGGMRERVRQLGDRLQIQSRGKGASILVVLPIRDEAGGPGGNGETHSSKQDGRVSKTAITRRNAI
jgi:signal transduction histidine kinase